MFKCASSYRCPAFFVDQINCHHNSIGDVFVECENQGDSTIFCGGSWTHESITKQMNASYNSLSSRRYLFFNGYSYSTYKDGIFQVIQSSFCMNSAIEPLGSGYGNFYFDSLNMAENTGSGNLAHTWGNSLLKFTNSIFFSNAYTAFGPRATFDNCTFCENRFITNSLCDPKRSTNTVVRCAVTQDFSVREQILSVVSFLWTSLIVGVN